MEIGLFIAGLLTGGVFCWFVARAKFTNQGIPHSEVEDKYILKTLYDSMFMELKAKGEEIIQLNQYAARNSEKSKLLEQRIIEHKEEIKTLQEQMKLEFKNISNQIFEDKSKKFLDLNEKKVFDILNPLRERIQNFEKKVDDTYKEEARERISLKVELKNMIEQSQKLSRDAEDLTNALKGDKKLQGNWGEIQLEQILKRAGLEKDIHYHAQKSFTNEEGQKALPDFTINLPDGKNLIIDSKVSLVAYERYFNEDNDTQKSKYLADHIGNLKAHISKLGDKNYQTLYDVNAPDYVMMFVPIEPALYLALRQHPDLYEKALDKNIVLVSTSTLLATLRTISFIWRQENQKNNVLEIARESGALYNKFCGFIDDLNKLGNRLKKVKTDYDSVMNKLVEGKQKKRTIIGHFETLKKLGAETTKSLPQSLVDRTKE